MDRTEVTAWCLVQAEVGLSSRKQALVDNIDAWAMWCV